MDDLQSQISRLVSEPGAACSATYVALPSMISFRCENVVFVIVNVANVVVVLCCECCCGLFPPCILENIDL